MLPLHGHNSPISALEFSADSQHLLSASKDGILCLWDGMQLCWQVATSDGNASALAFSKMNSLFHGGSNRHVYERNLNDGNLIQQIPINSAQGGITSLRWLYSGAILAIGMGERGKPSLGGIYFVTMTPKQVAPPLIRDYFGVTTLADHGASRLIAWANANREVIVRDLSKVDSVSIHPKYNVTSLAIAPDGLHIAVAADWSVKIFDFINKSARHVLDGHKGIVQTVAYTPDGQQVISGSSDRTIRIWHATGGKELLTMEFPLARITRIAIAPDGLRAAVGDETGAILLWDLDS